MHDLDKREDTVSYTVPNYKHFSLFFFFFMLDNAY